MLISLALVAMIEQVVSHRMWDRRVWACYAALGSGQTALPDRLLIPPSCKAYAIYLNGLGTRNAQIMFAMIKVSRRDGVMKAQLHHGSD